VGVGTDEEVEGGEEDLRRREGSAIVVAECLLKSDLLRMLATDNRLHARDIATPVNNASRLHCLF
jgi:hypothetical protein